MADRAAATAATPVSPGRPAARSAAVERRLDVLEQSVADSRGDSAPSAAGRPMVLPVAIAGAGLLIALSVFVAGGKVERQSAAVVAALAAAEAGAVGRDAAARERDAAAAEARAIEMFMPFVLSDDPATVRKGFTAMAALGYGGLAGRLTGLTTGRDTGAALAVIANAPAVDEAAKTAARAALEAVVQPSAAALAHVVVTYRAGDGLDLRSNGFVIDPRGYLVTTVHPFNALSASVLNATVHFASSQNPEEGIRASLVGFDEYLALLKLDGDSFPAASVTAHPELPAVDDYVTVLSYQSEHQDALLTPGRVLARTPEGNLLIDAAPGTSVPGAPVFDAAGDVVAVTRVALGQPLGTAIPIARALALMPLSATREQ